MALVMVLVVAAASVDGDAVDADVVDVDTVVRRWMWRARRARRPAGWAAAAVPRASAPCTPVSFLIAAGVQVLSHVMVCSGGVISALKLLLKPENYMPRTPMNKLQRTHTHTHDPERGAGYPGRSVSYGCRQNGFLSVPTRNTKFMTKFDLYI